MKLNDVKPIVFLAIIGVSIVLTIYTQKIGLMFAAGALIVGTYAFEALSEYYSEPRGNRNKQWIFGIAYSLGFTIVLAIMALYTLFR